MNRLDIPFSGEGSRFSPSGLNLSSSVSTAVGFSLCSADCSSLRVSYKEILEIAVSQSSGDLFQNYFKNFI